MMSDNSTFICPNCGSENLSESNYCGSCGQKNRALKVKIFEFITEFIDSVFNINNKFFNTLKYILVPGKLTRIFFEGKRKSFYHPLRIYIVSTIILFTVLSLLGIQDVIKIKGANLGKGVSEKILMENQAQLIKSDIESFKLTHAHVRSIDIIDSLAKVLYLDNGKSRVNINDTIKRNRTDFKLIKSSVSLSREQLFVEEIDSVVMNSGVENWFEKIILRQILKGTRDINSFNKFIFTNLTWLFLILIPVFSLVLKLFYIRRKRYYLEHFVFLLHVFTALIFVGIVTVLLMQVEELQVATISAAALVFVVFPFLAFKFYYQQSFIKTFIKLIGIGLFWVIAFTIVFSIFFVITAAFF